MRVQCTVYAALSHFFFAGPSIQCACMIVYVCLCVCLNGCDSKACVNYFVCRPHIRISKCVSIWMVSRNVNSVAHTHANTSNMQTELVNERASSLYPMECIVHLLTLFILHSHSIVLFSFFLSFFLSPSFSFSVATLMRQYPPFLVCRD